MHYQNTSRWLNSDIFRLTVTCESAGYTAQLLNGFISAGPGETAEVPVYIERTGRASGRMKMRLTAESESDRELKVSASTTIKCGKSVK